ncbi:hypothetical protein Acr_08g0013450 [Actinidia rufa]|uniref:Uncharacterized protein n=1 Tax=Actinidia rufa TaxID=165716 RepID=A0A7J0F3X5_9ERIC|nr:hypothetical protein Acr_08g0013450 [Actinidia rufa]
MKIKKLDYSICCGKKSGRATNNHNCSGSSVLDLGQLKGDLHRRTEMKGRGRGRSKPLRRGDQTKAITVDKRARRRVVEYVQLIRFWRVLVEIDQAKYSTSPKGEEETPLWLWASSYEYSDGGSGELSGDDLARFHGLVLPRSEGSEMSNLLRDQGDQFCDGSETTSGKRALDDGSKGKQVAQSPEPKKARIDTGASGASARPPVTSGAGSSARQVLSEALGPQASVMASAATAEKILARVVLSADKEKVDRLTFDQVVTKFLHVVGQVFVFPSRCFQFIFGAVILIPLVAGVILGSSLAVRSRDFAEGALNQKAVAESAEMEMVRAQNRAIELEGALAEEKAKGRKLAEDVDARGKVISKLEARISDLEKSQSLTQGRIIATFKESDDFLEAVRGSASSYFWRWL